MFEDVLLVRSVETRQTRAGEPFLRMTLGDRRQTVPAVLWTTAEIEAGAPVHVRGELRDHPRYGRQLTVEAIRPAHDHEIDWATLTDGPARPAAELERDLDTLIASVEDPALQTLLHRLLDRRYREAPAAKYNHHAYRSGLLEHSVQIAQLASAAAGVFDGIDRDLAVAGALLHDIGKLEAYDDVNGCADLTDAGRLESEIPLGYYRVRRELEDVDVEPERARALLHLLPPHP